MKTPALALSALAFSLAGLVAADPPPGSTPGQARPRPIIVDLDRPGALARLARERPSDHSAVKRILEAAEQMPCKDGELQALQVQYHVRDLGCGLTLLTSFPAKRRLDFTLGDVNYHATVAITHEGLKAIPAE